MRFNKVLKALADEESMSLFSAIAASSIDGKVEIDYISYLNLTRKQYYVRIRKLVSAGLIIKMKGPQNYRLTVFGQTVYHFLDILKIIASDNTYLKLKAIDAILFAKKSKDTGNENIVKLIDTLIDNHKTKDILLGIFEGKTNGTDSNGDTQKKDSKKSAVNCII